MNALWFYARRQGRPPATLPPAPASDLSPATLDATLARYGVALPASRAVATPAEARPPLRRSGFRSRSRSAHPTSCTRPRPAACRLDLRSRAEVKEAAAALIAAARATLADARIDGFLVQQMASGVEAIVGARSDALYGPLLLIGAGGVLVELARDVALRLLPVAAPDVGAMIDGLRLKQLLAGYRGRAAADRSALERTALALARFYLDHRSRIADIEINPLMIGPSGAIAVDVRVLWQAAP